MNRTRTTIAAVVAIIAGLLLAPAALAAADKSDVAGPSANAACDGSGEPWDRIDEIGFAVVNHSSDGTLMATVSLKKAQPETTYTVRLVQNVDDCFTIDGEIVTNKQGNGTLRVSEPSVEGDGDAIVVVDGGGGTYVGERYIYDNS